MPSLWISIAVVRLSLRALRRSPLRSALTILSAVLGTAGVISSVNYGLSGRQKIEGQLARLGTNVLMVTPRQSRSIGGRARTGALVTTLNQLDYDSIRRSVPLFTNTSAFLGRPYVVKAGNLVKNNCVVIGVEPGYMEVKGWTVQQGAAFSSSDLRRMSRVAVLGSQAARDLFDQSSPVGKRIFINRVPFEVVGVLTERGQSLDAANEDDQIYVPLTVAARRLTNVDYYSGILLSVTKREDMDTAAEQVHQVLRGQHRSSAKIPEDFEVQNQKQLLDTQLAASRQLLFYVRWIGIGTLAVSGLGVLAISWMSVKERTREIGTRRALGATRWQIFLQISAEAATLSLAGSALGFSLALESATALAKWADQGRVFDQPSAWLAATVSIGLNLTFAALPAQRAARLDPIEALRFE